MQLDILDFSQQLLSKCIPVKINRIKKATVDSLIFSKDSDFYSLINYHLNQCGKQYFKQCKTSTIINMITPFQTHYQLLYLSEAEDEHLVIGPFLENPMTDDLIYSIINNLHLTLDHSAKLKLYYQSVPLIDITVIYEILCTMYKYINPNDTSPCLKTLDLSVLPKKDSSYDLYLENMAQNDMYKELEKRYAEEEKLLSYITKGDFVMAQSHWKNFSISTWSIIRTKDSLRNTKNLLLISNTLFRKAAHMGGVHPVYLDELSGKWAIKIEQSHSFEELNAMPLQMIRAYCLLTKNHSLAQYSPIVQQALHFIHLNRSSCLTVKKVASEVGLSPDYLTRLFKKELGTTVISYINKKRIYTSLKLLSTTNLSIEEIGDLIGLNNTSYFSTLFKKEIGLSPKQYRDHLRSN